MKRQVIHFGIALCAAAVCLAAGIEEKPARLHDHRATEEYFRQTDGIPGQSSSAAEKPASERIEKRRSAVILCYHSFIGSHTYETDFSVTQLDEQISLLQKNGFRFISFEEYVAGKLSGSRNVLITIDDENVSAFFAYHAVIKKQGIHPLFSIYPSAVGKRSYAMCWTQIRELSVDGCAIASHGYSHQRLDDAAMLANPAMIEREIRLSKKIIEENTGKTVEAFVYPFGAHGRDLPGKLKAAGYRFAFTIRPGFADTPPGKESSFLIPRFMLTTTNARSLLKELCAPDYRQP